MTVIFLALLGKVREILVYFGDNFMLYAEGEPLLPFTGQVALWPILCKGTIWHGCSNRDLALVWCMIGGYFVLNVFLPLVIFAHGFGKYYHSGSIFVVFIYWWIFPKLTVYALLGIHLVYSVWFLILVVGIVKCSHYFKIYKFDFLGYMWYYLSFYLFASCLVHSWHKVCWILINFLTTPMRDTEETVGGITFLQIMNDEATLYVTRSWSWVFWEQITSVPGITIGAMVIYRLLQQSEVEERSQKKHSEEEYLEEDFDIRYIEMMSKFGDEPINVERAAFVINCLAFLMCTSLFMHGWLLECAYAFEIPEDLQDRFYCSIHDWVHYLTSEPFKNFIIDLCTFISVSVASVMQSLEWLYTVPEISNGVFNVLNDNFINIEPRHRHWYFIAYNLPTHWDGTPCELYNHKFPSYIPDNLVTYINLITPSEYLRILRLGYMRPTIYNYIATNFDQAISKDIYEYHTHPIEGTYIVGYL